MKQLRSILRCLIPPANKLKLIGLSIAFLSILLLSAITTAYLVGRRQGRLEIMTKACRTHNGYWYVKDGEKTFEFRYVPKWRDTCVVQEDSP